MHFQDQDCTVNPGTQLCVFCGVDHSDVCPDCGGRGFHKPNCLILVKPMSVRVVTNVTEFPKKIRLHSITERQARIIIPVKPSLRIKLREQIALVAFLLASGSLSFYGLGKVGTLFVHALWHH